MGFYSAFKGLKMMIGNSAEMSRIKELS